MKFIREMYLPECMLPTITHPPKLVAWGAICVKSKSKLVFTKGTVGAEVYIGKA